MKFPYLTPFLFLFGFIVGCASYKMGAIRDPGFKTIYIETFKSDVDEPALETLVTTTVIQQFQRDGTIEVTSPDRADVILKGQITSFQMTPVRFAPANQITPTEVSMSIGANYALFKRGQTKPYFKGQASGSTGFFIGDDLQSDKRQGVPLAAVKLGQNIVSTLADGW